MATKPIVMAISANKSDLVRSKKFDIQDAERYVSVYALYYLVVYLWFVIKHSINISS